MRRRTRLIALATLVVLVPGGALVVRPAFPVGKIPPLEVGTEGSDELMGQVHEITDKRHRLPPGSSGQTARPREA